MTARALNLESILIETSQYSIHRIETPDHGKVIVKASRSSQPSRKEISQLENEFRILKALEHVEGVPRAIRLDVESHKALLIMEDFGGISLRQYAENKPLRLDDFFAIAKKIVSIIGRLHANNIVHCDLKPMNMVINPSTKEIQIIDFGCSRHLVGRGQFQSEGQGVTLAYIAPEQTGRVNRRIDHRTDFYALGVTFYELLAGKLPFNGHDALEWVHAHIAKKARALHEVDHHITPATSQIVERMMNKAPEERYQTTEGLLHDLELAETLYRERRLWESIVVGERDRSTRILLSQKIVGREKELAHLSHQYLKCETDGLRVVSVRGEAGTGKSALGREFRRLYGDQVSLFGLGKADARQASFPFSTFATGIEDLVRQILNSPDAAQAEFKANLVHRLHSNLSSLLVIAPALRDIVQFEAAESAAEARERLFESIGLLFKLMTETFGPVVVQIDDAHFIDEPTAKAIAWLLQNETSLKLTFILFYRPSELTDSNHFVGLLDQLERNKTRATEISLRDLKLEDISTYLKDTLQDEKAEISELTDLLLRKSGGNPLFLTQVLKSWIDEQRLFHDPYRGWTWDRAAIEEQETAKSVLDLIGSKIRALPQNARSVFTKASCYTKAFTLIELCELTAASEEAVREATETVLEEGLLVSGSDTTYYFAHEKIREAFHGLMNPETRRALHAEIGLKLLAKLDGGLRSNEELYLAAEHLNIGISKIKDASLRVQVAELNYLAAQLAHASSAFDLSLKFANAGLQAGTALDWADPSDLLFKLYSLKGECEYLAGDFQLSQKTFGYIRANAVSQIAQVRCALQIVRLYCSTSRMLDATEEGISSLEKLGIAIHRKPSKLGLLFGLVRAAWTLRGGRIRSIPLLEDKTPDEQFIALRNELLVQTGMAGYFVDKKITLECSLASLKLAFREGFTASLLSGPQQVGVMLAQKFGWYQKAEEICKDSIDRIIGAIKPRPAAQVQTTRYALILHWVKPWGDIISGFCDVRDQAVTSGETFAASIATLYVPYLRLCLGQDVEEDSSDLESLAYLKKMDSNMYDCARPVYAFRAAMRGETASELDLSHAGFNESEYVDRISKANSPNPKSWYEAHKMMSLFMFGHYEKAAQYFEAAPAYAEHVPFAANNVLVTAFDALVCSERLRTNPKPIPEALKRIKRARKKLRRWLKFNPVSVEPYHFLVEAESAALLGNQLKAMWLFERSIEAALKTKSWMMAGVAYERAARFNLHHKRDRLARAFAEESAYCFERWGASAKVAQVRNLYGLTITRVSLLNDSQSSSSTDSRKLSERIDLESLMKTTRALSSELNIDVLSVKLTEIMMESSGASRALLLLPRDGQLAIKSQAGHEDSSYPSLVVDVFKQREQIVVVDSHENETSKADSYFSSRKPMSALAFPIVQKGEVLAIVYLENDSATNVFSSQMEILNVLAGQAGIALENARLYWEVSEKARMAGELKTAQAVQRTLFPNAQLKLDQVAVTGFYEPASECGGDWWFHHQNGDKLFVYIGDATGHGAPAALVTSAARSAVSLMSMVPELTPKKAMEYLNRAIFETSKGTMNMTFFIGAFNLKTGVFEYCNASHEPPFWIKKSALELIRTGHADEAQRFKDFKAGLGSLDDVHGPRLGEAHASAYRQSQVELSEDDLVILFTDGVQDARNSERQEWGQRRFLKALQKATADSRDVDEIVQRVVADNKSFTDSTPLDDDIMVIAIKSRLSVQ